MKKTRLSESLIIATLKEVELGTKVGETCKKHGVSQRRACNTSGISHSTLRYRAVPRDVFDLLYESACHQKQPWSKTVLEIFPSPFSLCPTLLV